MCEIKFQEDLKTLGIPADEKQLGMFEEYYRLLVETNKVMNLTAIIEKKDVYLLHFLDSLSLIPAAKEAKINMKDTCSIIDVGTGAGFPGVPLKIMMPEIRLTLLDSLNKRLNFLSSVVKAGDMKDVELIHARAEDGARDPKLREKFDFAVSRAVAPLPVLCEYCLPYVRVGGYFAAYKTAAVDSELSEAERAVRILGGKTVSTQFFTLPGSDVQRAIVFIQKCAKTPKTYPRKAGTPKSKPL
ncbi:MAG: 16S rRNA (guanine(527)-N(7))-methyltransferase RsmG [Lachnospiraceae bacterium]|nr:16S rRNA (guanine(527)-N(7))-methyltransferase RsmG [Lachnospiraceae bacterium]